MAKWALIINGMVHETTSDNPEGRFADDLQWESCAASVNQGWTFADGKFSAPAASLEDAKAARIIFLTSACAAAIVGGYSSGALGSDHVYPSGVTDQINMMGSVTASLLPELAPDWVTPFWCEDSDGLWAYRPHTASEIQQAGSDGKAHVVNCQSTLAQLSASIMAASTPAAVAAIEWPTNA